MNRDLRDYVKSYDAFQNARALHGMRQHSLVEDWQNHLDDIRQARAHRAECIRRAYAHRDMSEMIPVEHWRK